MKVIFKTGIIEIYILVPIKISIEPADLGNFDLTTGITRVAVTRPTYKCVYKTDMPISWSRVYLTQTAVISRAERL